MGKSKHDKIAEKGTRYPPDKGADIVTNNQAIEVEVDEQILGLGIRQLQGYRKRRYLVVSKLSS